MIPGKDEEEPLLRQTREDEHPEDIPVPEEEDEMIMEDPLLAPSPGFGLSDTARRDRQKRLLDDVPAQIRQRLSRASTSPRPPKTPRTALTVGNSRVARTTDPKVNFGLPRTVLLVGKARSKEVAWKSLNTFVRQRFIKAMAKEWSKWEQYKATIPCPADQLKKYPDDLKIIGTRWVLSYKSNGDPKARLVVQGCQERGLGLRADAPTGSKDAMMLVVAFGSQQGWSLQQFDAENAYLQSEGLDRSLLLRLPTDAPPPGRPAGEIRVATGAIYGTKDAGRKWYLHLKKVLASAGIVESKLERGMYRYVDKNDKVKLVIHTHVDDLLMAYPTNDSASKKLVANLSERLRLKSQGAESFEYLARKFDITKERIKITQPDAALALETIVLKPQRRRCPALSLDSMEKHEYRSLVGSLQWLAQQTRIDIAYEVSRASQRTENATIADVSQLNATAVRTRRTADRGLVFRRGVFDPQNVAVVAFGDAAFATAPGEKSQCGVVVAAVKQKDVDAVRNGRYDKAVVLSFKSATVKSGPVDVVIGGVRDQ